MPCKAPNSLSLNWRLRHTTPSLGRDVCARGLWPCPRTCPGRPPDLGCVSLSTRCSCTWKSELIKAAEGAPAPTVDAATVGHWGPPRLGQCCRAPLIPSALIACVSRPPTLQRGAAQVCLPSRRNSPQEDREGCLDLDFCLSLLGFGRPTLSVSQILCCELFQ